jgi:SAM-dependent methyltransferase
VICGELIEHVERPYDLMRSIRRVLEPGGRLVLSTPNPVAWPTLLAELLRSRRYFYTSEHAFYFTPRWLVRVLERTGYVVARELAVGLYLPGGVVPWCPVVLSYQVVYVAHA